jgi:hypothetical protein
MAGLFAVVTKSTSQSDSHNKKSRNVKYLSSEVQVSAKWPKLPHLHKTVRTNRSTKGCVLIAGSFPPSKRHDDGNFVSKRESF